jgi:hypothetical protein
MTEVKSSPFINAEHRRDSLSRLQKDALAKGQPATNSIEALTRDVVEAAPFPDIFTGCKEGTDKEKDKEKEKEREVRQPEYCLFRSIPELDEAGQMDAQRDAADLRLARDILVF